MVASCNKRELSVSYNFIFYFYILQKHTLSPIIFQMNYIGKWARLLSYYSPHDPGCVCTIGNRHAVLQYTSTPGQSIFVINDK